ncbi:hypothetical protein ACJDU8_24420 [Clostridium sp. WILCCON 0269]|uniref:Resolvase/invertase-type recombinase catalytic domain-containing protein n=1 Tax=Candidatus Clostridium eludens TaxID=3381663 RepID=A0ABW8SRW9_9CLOT
MKAGYIRISTIEQNVASQYEMYDDSYSYGINNRREFNRKFKLFKDRS